MIFFATPAYRSDPRVALDWASRTAQALGLAGSKAKVLHGCPWLHMGYALLVRDFLESECRLFMMRDDDVFPDAGTVGRMVDALERGAPAIVAPYKVRDEDRFDVVLEDDGRFRWAGVGCMMLQRLVLERLWDDHAGELGFMKDGRPLVAIFRDLFADRDDGVQLIHHDHAFWYRVRSAGFAVEVLDDVEVMHAGASKHYLNPAR